MKTIPVPPHQSEALTALIAFVEAFLPEARMMSDPVYGVFHGGDPRNFSPDPECSTIEERERHRIDCEKWERDERDGIGEPDCQSAFDDNGELSVHIQRSQYGLGVNFDSDFQELVHRAECALDVFNPYRGIARAAEYAVERILRSLSIW